MKFTKKRAQQIFIEKKQGIFFSLVTSLCHINPKIKFLAQKKFTII